VEPSVTFEKADTALRVITGHQAGSAERLYMTGRKRHHLSPKTWQRRYDQEEGGGVDESHDPFVGDDKLFDKRAAEMQKKLTRRDGSTMTLAQSKRASELQKDIHAWEENRLFRSGVVRAREVRGRTRRPPWY